jgi:hypothetical protein
MPKYNIEEKIVATVTKQKNSSLFLEILNVYTSYLIALVCYM